MFAVFGVSIPAIYYEPTTLLSINKGASIASGVRINLKQFFDN